MVKYANLYYLKNRERIRKTAHEKYLIKKQELLEEQHERKRYFLLCKKVDYLFGLKDSWI